MTHGRFDGVRLTVYNSANMPGLPSNRIVSLLETRDGSLWSRTDQLQLIRFRDGEFTHFGADHGIVDGGEQRRIGDVDDRAIPVSASRSSMPA